MTIKNIFLWLTVLLSVSFAQLQRRPAVTPFHSRIPFYAVIHVVPSDSLVTINYLYRIPYNQMVFVKQDDHYEARYSLSVEVFDTSRQFIARQIKEDNITVDDFAKTNSRDLYAQGLLQFNLPNEGYDLIPSITDKQSDQEAKLNHFRIKKLNSRFLDFLLPIVINGDKMLYGGNSVPLVTNFEGFVPFSQDKYSLLIPSVDTSAEEINVTIINEKDTVFNGPVSSSYKSTNTFVEQNGDILLTNQQGRQVFKNFVIDGFSNKLKVGDLKIIVSKPGRTNYSDNFQKKVVWFNKPFSLGNYEYAIKTLKYMATDSTISRLLDAGKENYEAVLSEFWDKYDPTPATEFNELMDEYYTRVDFALRYFGTIAGKSGVDTDRGRIFIKFGRPTYIERSSDEYGRMVERWVYKKEKLNFIFVDKTGTGDFPLVKG